MIRSAGVLVRHVGFLSLTACATAIRPTPPLPALPFAADTVREQVVRPGVTRRYIYAPSGPWAIHVLDVDLGCYQPVAVKDAAGAIGREKTSTLIRDLARTRRVVGGVNADFFLFAPPGVPSGALVMDGRVVAGPSASPVFAFTKELTPLITTLHVAGTAAVGAETLPVGAWNRPLVRGLALFDAGWGQETDSATSAIEVVVDRRNAGRVLLIDTSRAGVPIPPQGLVLVAGRDASSSSRAALLTLRVGDSVRAVVSLTPHPREAVGGRPVLVRDSVVQSAVDAEGAFSTGRHPRTAVGIAGAGRTSQDHAGRRLLLVVVDGRQKPHSDGMTLRELANLMLALGARHALNLDGGGSTTMVFADPDSSGALRVANRPSDAQGERAVGDALAIVDACRR